MWFLFNDYRHTMCHDPSSNLIVGRWRRSSGSLRVVYGLRVNLDYSGMSSFGVIVSLLLVIGTTREQPHCGLFQAFLPARSSENHLEVSLVGCWR